MNLLLQLVILDQRPHKHSPFSYFSTRMFWKCHNWSEYQSQDFWALKEIFVLHTSSTLKNVFTRGPNITIRLEGFNVLFLQQSFWKGHCNNQYFVLVGNDIIIHGSYKPIHGDEAAGCCWQDQMFRGVVEGPANPAGVFPYCDWWGKLCWESCDIPKLHKPIRVGKV